MHEDASCGPIEEILRVEFVPEYDAPYVDVLVKRPDGTVETLTLYSAGVYLRVHDEANPYDPDGWQKEL